MTDLETGEGVGPIDEWPPPAARVQAAAWEVEHLLERGHFAHAARTIESVLRLVQEDERGFYLGLRHLAAAGCRAEEGRSASGARQLAHARRRLAPFLPDHREVELVPLLDGVERRLGAR